jgi:hypothetical protein
MIERDGLMLVCGQRLRRPFGSSMRGDEGMVMVVVMVVMMVMAEFRRKKPRRGSRPICKYPSVG